MTQQYVYIPYVWRRQLAAMRLVLGCAAFVAELYIPLFSGVPVMAALLAIYCAWALSVLLSRKLEQINYSSWSLLLDFLFFATSSLNTAPQLTWLSRVIIFFLLLNASLLFSWQRVLILSVAAVAFSMINRVANWQDLWPTVLLAGTLATVLSVLKKQLLDRIEQAMGRSVVARAEAEVARVHERQRLAHDFHDGPLQCYNSFLIRLQLIRKLIEKGHLEKVDAEVANMQEIANHQVTEMRMFVRAMQPSEWDGENASSGFRDILKLFQKDTGIEVTYSADEDLVIEDQTKFTELLQVFREALHNIQKHSRASQAAVAIDHDDNRVRLQIEDNGNGFEFAGAFNLDELETMRLGPSSIKRRVRALGGNIMLRSRPGEGAQLEIEIPV